MSAEVQSLETSD